MNDVLLSTAHKAILALIPIQKELRERAGFGVGFGLANPIKRKDDNFCRYIIDMDLTEFIERLAEHPLMKLERDENGYICNASMLTEEDAKTLDFNKLAKEGHPFFANWERACSKRIRRTGR